MLFSAHSYGQEALMEYRKPLFDFDPEKTTFEFKDEQRTNKSRFLRYYALSGYREGVKPTANVHGSPFEIRNDLSNRTTRYFSMNRSIEDILTDRRIPQSSVLLEVEDPSKYRYDLSYGPELEWLRKNAKCYEILLPVNAFMSFTPVKQLLNSLFGVEAGMEKRMVKVYVLKRTSSVDKLKSIGGAFWGDYKTGKFSNCGLNVIVKACQQDYIVVDETRYEGAVDLDLKISDWKDINAVRKALKRYDLSLTEEIREREMFVIKEVKK